MQIKSNKIKLGVLFLRVFFPSAKALSAQVIYRKLAFKDEFNKLANSPIESTT